MSFSQPCILRKCSIWNGTWGGGSAISMLNDALSLFRLRKSRWTSSAKTGSGAWRITSPTGTRSARSRSECLGFHHGRKKRTLLPPTPRWGGGVEHIENRGPMTLSQASSKHHRSIRLDSLGCNFISFFANGSILHFYEPT